MSLTAVVTIDRTDMARMLRTEPAIFDGFMKHLVLRSLRAQDDLVDQLVSSCEQRLVRALLLLSRYGKYCKRPKKVLPTMSQSTLAGIVGSTRSRVNYFTNRFERLGLLETSGGLTVKRSLLRYSQDTTHAR